MKQIVAAVVYSLVLIVIYYLISFEVAALIAMANINIRLIGNEVNK